MPAYELNLLFRNLAKPQLHEAIKRCGGHVFESKGFIRDIEYLGGRPLPARRRKHGNWHKEGHFVLLKVDVPFETLTYIRDEYNRDADIISNAVFRIRPPREVKCTLEEELLPPSERPSVQELIEQGRRPPKFAKFFTPNTGLDYYPFHR